MDRHPSIKTITDSWREAAGALSTPYKSELWWFHKDYVLISKRQEECQYDEELTVESIIYERYIQRCLRDGLWVKKAIIQKYYENLQ